MQRPRWGVKMRMVTPRAFALLVVLISGCASAPTPRLSYATYDSQAMHVPMSYAVYTPPHFRDDERLPLVVFLHGGGDSHESLDHFGIGQRFDRAIERGDLPRFVAVVPDGQLGFWANWRDGTHYYEDWVVRELLPHAEQELHTLPCPDGCHVIGVSMGGSGALRFALHHPELFASAGIISAPVFDTDAMIRFSQDRFLAIFIPTHRIWGLPPRSAIAHEDPFVRWQTPEDAPGRLYLGWAEHDRGIVKSGSRRLHRHLREHDIPHGSEEFRGNHGWVSWAPVIERSLAYQLQEHGAGRAHRGTLAP